MMNEKVKLIAITHVPTNGGLVNPAEAVGTIARNHKVFYLLDACQSVGQMPLDVKAIGCDFLSATSRKYLRGPRGLGFLYVNKEKLNQLEPPVLDLHGATWQSKDTYQVRSDARRFENWEFNLAAVVGLGAAVRYMLDIGIDKIWNRLQFLADKLRTQLDQLPGVNVHDLGQVKSGIVSFTGPFKVHKFKEEAVQAGFNVSIIRADGTLLDMQSRNLQFMVRASVHYYNSEEELDRFVQFVKGYVER
jgi:selenocysteine lyase/cysteine desulfurase